MLIAGRPRKASAEFYDSDDRSEPFRYLRLAVWQRSVEINLRKERHAVGALLLFIAQRKGVEGGSDERTNVFYPLAIFVAFLRLHAPSTDWDRKHFMTEDNKKSCLERAKGWLSNPTTEGIRYAALEVRLVMEMLTYEKLKSAAHLIPPSVLQTWQPPQALRALLEFQPKADQSFKLAIGVPKPDGGLPDEWLELGEHHAMPLKWLRKNYNKVGNMLHAPMPHQTEAPDLSKHAARLNSIVVELEKVLTSGITGVTWSAGHTFECADCGETVVRSVEAMEAGKVAICPKQGCDAEYKLVKGDDDQDHVERVVVPVECQGCKTTLRLKPRRMEVGYEFTCTTCGTEHQLSEIGWVCVRTKAPRGLSNGVG